MNKNDPTDKNQSAGNPAVERQVEKMLGPPPQSAEPTPPAEPEAPVKPQPEEKPPKAPEPTESVSTPKAGDTIVPTNPATEEAKLAAAAAKKAQGGKIKRFFSKWWHNKKARNLTFVALGLILIGLALWPTSRYFVLNTVGVRSSASMVVVDNSTQLPLKNVQVDLGGQSAKTGDDGKVTLQKIKLGKQKLVIQKRAFATIDQNITIGLGSNPLGNFQITPTGSQYTIYVKEWLTGKTISEASASAGEADANSDQDGKIVLTIDTEAASQDRLDIIVKADGYRDEKLNIDLDDKSERTAKMVINRKDVFVSNRSGRYNVYSIDIDGKNEKMVLAASGLEQDDIVLVQNPAGNRVAIVSTRVNARNNDDFLLSTLTLLNLEDESTQAIAQAEQVQIIGWANDKLVYVQIAAGASAANPERFKLMTYDYKTSEKKQLASANAFNDVLLTGNVIYYAPSQAANNKNNGLVRSNVDGSDKETLIKEEVWNIFRVSFDTLNVATAKTWYEYKLGSSAEPVKMRQAPANPKNRLYISSPDGKNSLWVDPRDGKGLLINYDIDKQEDKTLVTKGGLNYPVQWLTKDVLIYRVDDGQMTADYVMSIGGGTTHKVTDLYDAAGIDRWYYY